MDSTTRKKQQRLKFGHVVKGRALDYYAHLVGKELVKRPGKKGSTIWMVCCETRNCKIKFPLHAVLLSGVRRCIFHRHDKITKLILQQKGNLRTAASIVRVEQKLGSDNRLRRIAYVKCETKTCVEEFRVSDVIRRGHTKCLRCREGAKFIAGHYCRNKFVLAHANMVVSTNTSGRGRTWSVLCAGSEHNKQKCTAHVRMNSKKHISEHKCRKCRPYPLRNAPFTAHYKSLVISAKKRGIPVRLSFKTFQKLCCCKYCFYCGAILIRKVQKQKCYPYAIDRADNDKGYVPGNMVPCCGFCNRVKWYTLSAQQMLVWASINNKDYARAKHVSLLSQPQIKRLIRDFVKKQSRL